MSKPVVAAQLYTVRESTQDLRGMEETLAKVKKIGYRAVQMSAQGPMNPNELAAVIRESGVRVAATHTAWERFLTDIDAVIEEHRAWECVHAAIGGLPSEYYEEGGMAKFLGELGPVADRLSAEGMDFSYHNHNHELAPSGGSPWLELLYEKAAPRHLKAEIDTYWIQAGGADPAEWTRKCAGRLSLLHVKDMTVTPDGQQRFAEIGEGNLNWPAILAAAEGAGVEYLLVEQDDCYGRDPFESLAISYRNLSRMGYE
jgi:sugar phosphate isomerase/epimerase